MHPCSFEKPAFSCNILDGPVIALVSYTIFSDYTLKVFSPFIYCQLESCIRNDIVWEFYEKSSLKASEKSKRGSGHIKEFCQTLRFQVTGILSDKLMRTVRNCCSFWQLKHHKIKATR